MFAKIEKIVGIAAASLLFLLMMVTLVDVTGRSLLNSPLFGATELTELLLVSMTFLIYPIIAIRQKHIVIDLIDGITGPVLRMLQTMLTAMIGAGIFGIMAWRLWILADRAMSYGDATASLRFPTGPVYYGMAVFAAITAIAFLGLIPRALKYLKDPRSLGAGNELI